MSLRYIPVLVFLSVIGCQTTQPAGCGNTNNSFRCVEYVSNYDGDTVTFNISGLHPLLGHHVSVRVNGVDTPEIKTHDMCEKSLALTAKDYVTNVLKSATSVDLVNIKRGKYFRIVADVIVDGQSLRDMLLQNNLAVRYDGGEKKHTWVCRT